MTNKEKLKQMYIQYGFKNLLYTTEQFTEKECEEIISQFYSELQQPNK